MKRRHVIKAVGKMEVSLLWDAPRARQHGLAIILDSAAGLNV